MKEKPYTQELRITCEVSTDASRADLERAIRLALATIQSFSIDVLRIDEEADIYGTRDEAQP